MQYLSFSARRLARTLAIARSAAQCAAMAVAALAPLAHAATSSTATVVDMQTFNVAVSPLGGIGICAITTGPHSYGTSSFTTSTAATYSFTATATTLPDGDPFLAIYKGSFNPAAPTTNLVGCNDDSDTLLPEFSAALEAGTTYVMVATSYYNGALNGSVTFSAGIVPTLALPNLSAVVGASGKSMVATSNATGTISYSINNPAIATINASTGALTLLSAGTATVTATQAPEASPGLYNGGSVNATLTVTAAPPPAPPGATAVPTLSEWGLALLSLLAAAFGLRAARRRA